MTTESKPILEYRLIRKSDGTLFPQNDGSPTYTGHFIVGWSAQTEDPARPITTLQWSRAFSKLEATFFGSFSMLQSKYLVADPWSTNQPHTQIALFSDSSIGNMFGLAAWSEGLYFLPHADGAPDHNYSAKSDFRVVEDGTCFVLRDAANQGQGQAFCGEFVED